MPATAVAWACRRCGSTEQRAGRKACAECHRRRAALDRQRERENRHPGLSVRESRLFNVLLADDFAEIEVTPAVGGYLAAFEQHLQAQRDGDHRALRSAKARRRAVLADLEGPPPSPQEGT